MPIDDFQKKVIKAIVPLRSPGSTFAGGSVLQRHGFRLSDDQDLFHSDDADIASIDALISAGFDVEVLRPLEGLFEALVSREGEGATRIQWVQSGSPEHAGKLFVNDNGGIVSDVDRILAGRVNLVETQKGRSMAVVCGN